MRPDVIKPEGGTPASLTSALFWRKPIIAEPDGRRAPGSGLTLPYPTATAAAAAPPVSNDIPPPSPIANLDEVCAKDLTGSSRISNRPAQRFITPERLYGRAILIHCK